jgi:hypothetical protein
MRIPRTRAGRELLERVAERISAAELELGAQDEPAPPRFSPAEARMLRARGVTLERAEAALRSSGE